MTGIPIQYRRNLIINSNQQYCYRLESYRYLLVVKKEDFAKVIVIVYFHVRFDVWTNFYMSHMKLVTLVNGDVKNCTYLRIIKVFKGKYSTDLFTS